MSTLTQKPVKERDDMDLLELVCQLHLRALKYPLKETHDAYVEARTEIETRLKSKDTQITTRTPKEPARQYSQQCQDRGVLL